MVIIGNRHGALLLPFFAWMLREAFEFHVANSARTQTRMMWTLINELAMGKMPSCQVGAAQDPSTDEDWNRTRKDTDDHNRN